MADISDAIADSINMESGAGLDSLKELSHDPGKLCGTMFELLSHRLVTMIPQDLKTLPISSIRERCLRKLEQISEEHRRQFIDGDFEALDEYRPEFVVKLDAVLGGKDTGDEASNGSWSNGNDVKKEHTDENLTEARFDDMDVDELELRARALNSLMKSLNKDAAGRTAESKTEDRSGRRESPEKRRKPSESSSDVSSARRRHKKKSKKAKKSKKSKRK